MMKRKITTWSLLITSTLLILSLLTAGCGGGGGGGGSTAPVPTETTTTIDPSPTSTVSPSPTVSPTSTDSPTPTPSPTSTATGTLQGNVASFYTASDVSGVTVSVNAKGIRNTVVTGSDGNFQFSNLPVGNYAMALSKTGYFNLGRDVHVLDGQTTAENFQMIVMPGQGSWVAVGDAEFTDSFASFCSLLVTNDYTWAAYTDSNVSDSNTVMRYDGSNWTSVASPVSSSDSWFQELGTDNGDIYLAYMDQSAGGRCTVRKLSTINTWDLVGAQGFTSTDAYSVSMTFKDNNPYVAYSDYAELGGIQNRASVMYYNGISWGYLGAQGFSSSEAGYTSIENIGGVIHVAYVDGYDSGGAPEGGVTVMKYNGTSWEVVGSAEFSDGVADFVQLQNYLGQPCVAYSDASLGDKIVVMRYDGSSWQAVGNKGFSTGKASYIGFKVYNDVPYVVFADEGSSSNIRVMRFDGGNWVDVGTPGFTSSDDYYIHIDVHNGTPYFIYENNVSNKATVVKYQEP